MSNLPGNSDLHCRRGDMERLLRTRVDCCDGKISTSHHDAIPQIVRDHCDVTPETALGIRKKMFSEFALEKQAHRTVSVCEKTSARSEPWKVGGGIGNALEKIPQNDGAAFGNQWYLGLTTAGGSNTNITRQHPELGQVRLAGVGI